MRKVFWVTVALLFCVSAIYAGTVYVKVKKAPIKDKPSARSGKTLKWVKFKTPLTVVKKEGKWYKVKYKGKTGYIYGSKVSKSKPSDDASLTAEDGGVKVAELDTAGAARGLGPTAEAYAKRAEN